MYVIKTGLIIFLMSPKMLTTLPFHFQSWLHSLLLLMAKQKSYYNHYLVLHVLRKEPKRIYVLLTLNLQEIESLDPALLCALTSPLSLAPRGPLGQNEQNLVHSLVTTRVLSLFCFKAFCLFYNFGTLLNLQLTQLELFNLVRWIKPFYKNLPALDFKV